MNPESYDVGLFITVIAIGLLGVGWFLAWLF